QLVELPDVRTACVRNPAGKVVAWTGSDTRETMQRFVESRTDLAPPFLAHEFDAGSPGLDVIATFAGPPRPPKQHEASHAPDGRTILAYHASGWRLVVFCQDAPSDQGLEQIHRRMQTIWKTLARLLIHQGQE